MNLFYGQDACLISLYIHTYNNIIICYVYQYVHIFIYMYILFNLFEGNYPCVVTDHEDNSFHFFKAVN